MAQCGEVLAVYPRSPTYPRPTCFVELTHAGGQIAGIRDFYYMPYVAAGASITPSHTNEEGGGGDWYALIPSVPC